MKSSLTQALGALVLGWCCTTTLTPAVAQNSTEQQDKEGCSRNLKTIYEAVQAFERDHRDLPNWLSDLVPNYVTDPNVLVCPICRRTGKTEDAGLADPKISSSYLFEFCPLPLGDTAPNAANRTRREWKRRQMGLVGSVVPIVRCRHHPRVLNMSFDGRIYESDLAWETMFTNRISADQLTAARLFADERGSSAGSPGKEPFRRQFANRDPKAGKQQLDLTTFYNAIFTESWHGNSGNDLADLPSGLQTLAGIQFDLRGIVQLGGTSVSASNFPPEVKGIKVRQKCKQLHFLHAGGYGNPGMEGKQIGSYIVHFATSQMRLEIPIVYGREVRDWHDLSGDGGKGGNLKVGWTGQNGVSRQARSSIRLFVTTWTNVVPDIEIESIDFVSAMTECAPFLIAITAD